jgi:hypothetical protein
MRGLSLDDVAAATRIPRRSLERLEAGAFDGSPDGFSRGFVRAVADAIGLDATEAMARLLGEAAPARGRRGAPAPWVLGLVAALAVAGALAALPALWSGGSQSDAAESVAPAATPVATGPRRRDFVRELAAQVRAQRPRRGGAETGGPAAP